MTGEMSRADLDEYPTHKAVARALRGSLHPFDVYAGPYIRVPEGKLWLACDGATDPTVVLWPGGVAPAYCEPVVEYYGPDDEAGAIAGARALLRRYRRERREAAKPVSTENSAEDRACLAGHAVLAAARKASRIGTPTTDAILNRYDEGDDATAELATLARRLELALRECITGPGSVSDDYAQRRLRAIDDTARNALNLSAS